MRLPAVLLESLFVSLELGEVYESCANRVCLGSILLVAEGPKSSGSHPLDCAAEMMRSVLMETIKPAVCVFNVVSVFHFEANSSRQSA